jgi:DNA-binding GntR family transcriptional regulator
VLAVQRRVGLSVREDMKPISLSHQKQRFEQQQQAHGERKTRLQSEEARYTVILHHPRKKLGMTINEYCLADAVHKLSGTRSMVPGWCYASKEHLAESLGFSRRSIHNMINSLKGKGILEVQQGTGYLRTSELWHDSVEIFRDKVFGQ